MPGVESPARSRRDGGAGRRRCCSAPRWWRGGSSPRAADAAVPDGSLTARNAMEMFVEWFTNFATGILGPDAKQYAPLYGALFLFILCHNLIGLLPGFAPPTATSTPRSASGSLRS